MPLKPRPARRSYAGTARPIITRRTRSGKHLWPAVVSLPYTSGGAVVVPRRPLNALPVSTTIQTSARPLD